MNVREIRAGLEKERDVLIRSIMLLKNQLFPFRYSTGPGSGVGAEAEEALAAKRERLREVEDKLEALPH